LQFDKRHSQINSTEEGIQQASMPAIIPKLGERINYAPNDSDASVTGDGDSGMAMVGRKHRQNRWVCIVI
jgi:hypothetical protein